MMLADSDVWLALALSKHMFHNAARTWLAKCDSSKAAAFCRSTQQSFLRLLTTKAVLAPYGLPPMRNTAAWQLYEQYVKDERVSWAEEPPVLKRTGRGLPGIRKHLRSYGWMHILQRFPLLADTSS